MFIFKKQLNLKKLKSKDFAKAEGFPKNEKDLDSYSDSLIDSGDSTGLIELFLLTFKGIRYIQICKTVEFLIYDYIFLLKKQYLPQEEILYFFIKEKK